MNEPDVLSKLPTCIVHNIMSFLERKDIVRMQTLSKTWRGIYELYPCLEFFERQHMKSSIPLAPEYRFRKLVNGTLQRFRQQRLYITSFDLVMHLEFEYDSARLDAWIELLITECNVKEISLWIGYREQHRLPGILFTSSSLTKFITTGGSINYTDSMIFGQCSLRILELKYVTIDEEVIKNLKYCCPFLESISIVWCYGYKRFIVDGLNRLKSLNYFHNVDALDVSIMIGEAPRLEVLDLSYINRKCQVSVTSDFGLPELKRLVLTNFSREGEFVENIIRMSCCSLEYLKLSSCVTPEQMVISSPSLKTVIIESLSNLQKIELDTPKLCSFTFRGKKMHPLLLPDDIPSSRRHWCAELLDPLLHGTIDDAWFQELVTFVGTNQFQVLKLRMVNSDMKDISLAESLVSSDKVPIKLQSLQIEFKHLSEPSDDISVLLDALIIRFRPRHLSFRFLINSREVYPSNSKVLEYLGRHSKTEETLSCCESSPLKCWRHFLKGVVERIDDENP